MRWRSVGGALQLGTDLVCELGALGAATEVSSEVLALLDGLKGGAFNLVGVLVELHVAQHHHRGQQQGGGVGQVLAGNIRSGAVHRLEERSVQTHVAGGRQAEAANQTGAHVGQNITVQIGHDLERNRMGLYFYGPQPKQ